MAPSMKSPPNQSGEPSQLTIVYSIHVSLSSRNSAIALLIENYALLEPDLLILMVIRLVPQSESPLPELLPALAVDL